MKKTDRQLRKAAAAERREVPDYVRNRTEQLLASLPEKQPAGNGKRIILAAASLFLALMVVLPNISVTYAETMGKIPVIGDLIRVLTIREYLYSDSSHEMEIRVPEVDHDAFASANSEIVELTDRLLKQFQQDLETLGDEAHSAIYMDYSVITNSSTWFTLKIQVVEAAGSGNTYYRYYHLDKMSGKTVTLADLFPDPAFYEEAEQDIRQKMKARMENNESEIYWVDDGMFKDCLKIGRTHHFFWNEDGELVIPFDKYEVAPGYMGTPEFTVSREITERYLDEAYAFLKPAGDGVPEGEE